MATREPTSSISDSPPPLSKSDATPAPRSEIAPRPRTLPPGTLPDLPRIPSEDESVEFPPGSFSPDDAIEEQIADLERWAVANERKELKTNIRFWILRGTAFLSAVLAAIAGPLGQPQAASVLAGVAALFVAIDSAWPGSGFRNPHRRAVYDLRTLQNSVQLRWDKVRLAHPNPTAAKRVAHALALLDSVQAKRDEVGKYLGDAEASRGAGTKSA